MRSNSREVSTSYTKQILCRNFETLADCSVEFPGCFANIQRKHAKQLSCTFVTCPYTKQVDIVIHSLANGPEVTKPLLETSRRGYLAASSASAFSMVSLVQKFAPIMPKGGSVVSLTYIASEKVCWWSSFVTPSMSRCCCFCLWWWWWWLLWWN